MEKIMGKLNSKIRTNNVGMKLVIDYLPVLVLLFLFLIGIKSLSSSFKMMGSGFAEGLLSATSNPFMALMSGMLATVLVQSSSVTTSVIVGLVSSGALGVGAAVPLIMGANLGTSITNTLVSLGFVGNKKDFSRAFAAGSIHDIFNILSVAVILPFELATGILASSAEKMSSMIYGMSSNVHFKSPLKTAIKPFVNGLKGFVTNVLGFEGSAAAITLCLLSIGLILVTLYLIVKITKKIVQNSKGEILENLLSKNVTFTIFFGAVLTFAVQSSSITTSLLVPVAAAGMLSIESIFPVTVGANIGTTTTALLASLTGNVHGLTIALVHFLFNILGMLIWFIPSTTRQIPLKFAKMLAHKCEEKRRYGFLYVSMVFFIIPLVFAVIFPYLTS